MKLLDLVLKNVSVPFKESCVLTITNCGGEEVVVDCEVPSTDEEKMTGLILNLIISCYR